MSHTPLTLQQYEMMEVAVVITGTILWNMEKLNDCFSWHQTRQESHKDETVPEIAVCRNVEFHYHGELRKNMSTIRQLADAKNEAANAKNEAEMLKRKLNELRNVQAVIDGEFCVIVFSMVSSYAVSDM